VGWCLCFSRIEDGRRLERMVHWLREEWRGFEEMEGEKGDSIDMSARISSTAAIISATA